MKYDQHRSGSKPSKNNRNRATERAINNQNKKQSKHEKMIEEIERLNSRIREEKPKRGYVPKLQQFVTFRALPISDLTLRGLEEIKGNKIVGGPFTTMTDIQNACIPHALGGRDILGAAKTGSGKTLAFLVPVLECLYRNQFVSNESGVGAIILTPTRELALQIFHVLQEIGKYHTLAIGLLIGGKKDFYMEQQHIGATNILIASPGRLLQHLEQTPNFSVDDLRMLVLDEADRILDLGFRQQLLHILEYLPKQTTELDESERRQTLLFSATQTRSVSHLATLSLNQPEYIGVHDSDSTGYTPNKLQQSYVIVPLQHKLNAIYSFVKSHLKSKSIVFMSSCTQIRYTYELFCKLQPGIVIMAIHGKLNQEKRTKIYFEYMKKHKYAVLFATDIASRGLDFPNVDWVVQVDAPEDKSMYIHRVGRTARYKSGGKSLLYVTPQEEKKGFIKLLTSTVSASKKKTQPVDRAQEENKKAEKNLHQNSTSDGGNISSISTSSKVITIKKLDINPTKIFIVSQKAASIVAANVKLQQLAKKAYQSYVRSIYLMPNKTIFDVTDLPLEEYSSSLVLPSAPKLRNIITEKLTVGGKDCEGEDGQRNLYRKNKNVNKKLQKLKEQIKAEKLAKRIAKLGSKGTTNDARKITNDEEDSDDDDILRLKSTTAPDENDGKNSTIDDSEEDLPNYDVHKVTKPRKSKQISIYGSNYASNQHVKFDSGSDDSSSTDDNDSDSVQEDDKGQQKLDKASEQYIKKVRKRLQSNFEQDRTEERERIREKHKKRRLMKSEEDKGNNEQMIENHLPSLLPDDSSNNRKTSNNKKEDGSLDDDKNGNDDASHSSSSEESSNSSAESTSTQFSEEENLDALKTQEEMALSLIRN